MKKSLQVIKNGIIKKDETLKALENTHPHLANLSEIEILAYFNAKTIPELEQHIKESTQAYDDISIQDTQLCSCTDSKGQNKDLYDSEASAQKEADILIAKKKIKLKIYPCPDTFGWHLSKK